MKMLSIIPVLPQFQGAFRREWLRAKDNRYKIETEMPSFLLFLVNLWAQGRSQAKAV
jgi:hypothetical protein